MKMESLDLWSVNLQTRKRCYLPRNRGPTNLQLFQDYMIVDSKAAMPFLDDRCIGLVFEQVGQQYSNVMYLMNKF